ncbi:hybrid sensor histidine kinase/response regulator [Aphanothece hegewaldii CCALA 016]|uniref:histidine kinase n=1 Tax=Aphanothece hegewaldii CCALA 016 TaxID=2107694 RepID=A0A2T1LW37_9CHRO|nr:response regulator [Aphanothece hegewaldii]PSF36124.1 hybrid sensor histidine kinase/response regulator [Aphanothece hegewaldii CCALA 016]
MSFQIDEATLAAMTQEARICFLEEDAPQYLQTLEIGLQQRHDSPNFIELQRATHSLKGGAGLAQLPSLRELSHRLEDLLQAIQQQTVLEIEEAWTLLEWGVSEVANLLNQARMDQVVDADFALLEILASFTPTSPEETLNEPTQTVSASQLALIQKALTQDLESCITTVTCLSPDASPDEISNTLNLFFDECLLLGETLDLPWLIAEIEPLELVLAETSPEDALLISQQLIIQLRSYRDQYLAEIEPVNSASEPSPVPKEEKVLSSQVRVPLKRLEDMTYHVEELILTRERLRLQQEHLQQANQRLRDLSQVFEPIREQIQLLYDQVALAPIYSSGLVLPKNDSNLDFDALELDRYTELHSSLQTFQELMLRIQETRADLDLINHDFAENLEQSQSNLDGLYNKLTQSRLVPFRILAQRFIPQLQNLNRRYGKSVDLLIEGEETLVDQVVLENLQTPLTHLLNNAFDHGIESISDRLACGKTETAQIILSAKVDNNTLIIQLKDDGQGIDLLRIYQQAKERGLCLADSSFEQYHSEQILDWIFQPNFSTAQTVSDLSGRGVGLDIVRTQIQRLRGTVQVKTQAKEGTTFILKLPLNLSLMSLSLIQVEQRLIALPSLSILESLPYKELEWLTSNPPTVQWRQQIIPVISLGELLPCPQLPLDSVNPRVALVVSGAFTPFVITVNSLIGERLLIVKPFDQTIVIPAYLAGCTILGNGEIVPVLLPEAFPMDSAIPLKAPTPTIVKTPTILVAEDSVATRRLLERILTQVGYTTLMCRDGQEALDTLAQHPDDVSLVISDVEMPRLNGFELLQQMRSSPKWKHIPVIMATSRTGDRHQQQAMQLGANAYLGKPIQAQEFLTTIEALLTNNLSFV